MAGAPTDAAAAGEEMVECARYGDYEDVVRFVDAGVDVNYQDEFGNSALHCAAANGHFEIVKFLVKKQAKLLPNDTGNTPLHWAVQNKEEKVVKYLVKKAKGVDVLQKNNFGKGSVTLAFNVECPDIVTILLKHESANALEKEHGDAVQTDADDDKPDEAAKNTTDSGGAAEKADVVQTVTHEFKFSDKCPVIKVREMGSDWVGQVFGDDASEDTTGMHIWASSLIFSRWLNDLRVSFRNQSVCELGAGCGLPGLTVSAIGKPDKVLLTDYFKHTVDNLRHNSELNKNDDTATDVSIQSVDWTNKESWPKGKFDIVLGCDLVYDVKLVPALVSIVDALLTENGTMFYVCGAQRQGSDVLMAELESLGLHHKEVSEIPASYKENPLVGETKDKVDLYFNELEENVHSLHEFYRGKGGSDKLIERNTAAIRAELEQIVKKSNET